MKQLFQQITAIWSEGTKTQRALAVLSVLVIGGGVLASTWLASRPDNALLFGNLEPSDAAAVVEEVRGAGVVAELRDGGRSVYVPRDQVAEMRVLVSSAGLPRGNGSGWELFDKSSFGVSDFEQTVTYKRALEGELARSVSAFDAVESARVSITKPKRSPFVTEREAAKASVMVRTRSGMQLSRDNVASIKHMIAGAVEGLDPDLVSVMDTKGRMLAEPGSDSLVHSASEQLELRREMESLVESKAQAMLDQVGVAAVVRVALDIDFQQIRQTSETFSPEGRVAQERVDSSKSRPAGASEGPVGTGSKVDDGLSLPSASATLAQSEDQETIETTYKLDRTVKSEEMTSPVVRRMTVSLVLGREFEDRAERIQDIVKTAVGFDDTRGDRIEWMPHEFSALEEGLPEEEIAGPPMWLMLAERGIQVLGVLGALFLVFRVLKLADRSRGAAPTAAAAAAAGGALDVVAGEDGPELVEEVVPAGAAAGKAETVELDADEIAASHEAGGPSIQELIKNTIATDPAAATRVLRAWLREGNQIR